MLAVSAITSAVELTWVWGFTTAVADPFPGFEFTALLASLGKDFFLAFAAVTNFMAALVVVAVLRIAPLAVDVLQVE